RDLHATPATPEVERRADWNFGSWVHVDDLAAAVVSALSCPPLGHVVLLVSARDTTSIRTTPELLDSLYSGIPWRGPELSESDPYMSLADASRAEKVLGWRPAHRFHE